MRYKNIKAIRENNRLTQQAAADALSIPLTTYRSYETGAREPNVVFLTAFADKFGVSVDEILDYHVDTDRLSQEEADHIQKYRTLDDYGKSAVDSVLSIEYNRVQDYNLKDINKTSYIHIKYNELSVSAGNGVMLSDYENWDSVLVPLTPISRKASFVLRVCGDSMEPMFQDGDFVLVHRQENVDIGEIGIFSVDNNGYIKKFGGNVLISLNDKYDDIPLDADSVCFGKVIGKTAIE